jgi:small subunit ribosomal protein S20
MPTSKQAKKRVRQNEKHRLRHKARRSELKTLEKRIAAAITEKDVAKAQTELKALQKKLDKAGAFHTLHANTVARRKSRLQRKLNKIAKPPAAAAKK